MSTTFPISNQWADGESLNATKMNARVDTRLNDLASQALVTTSGNVNVNITTAGTPASVAITFPTGFFPTIPRVVTNVVNTSVPQSRASSAGALASTGCTIFAWSASTGTVTVHWIATLS